MKKKNKIENRCSMPVAGLRFDQSLEPIFPEDDNLYFPEQIVVTCDDGFVGTASAVECEVDGDDITIVNCE